MQLLTLRPDIAVISECACPNILAQRGPDSWIETDPVWIGENRHKGLGVFAFNGYRLRLYEPFLKTLRHIAPVHVSGPRAFNLLAVWAQNASGGITRKHQLGPLRRALSTYNDFLAQEDAVIAGDLNSNAIWDKPGWRIKPHGKGRDARETGPFERLSHAFRRSAWRGDGSHPLLARPDEGRPDLSHRLYVRAPGTGWPGRRISKSDHSRPGAATA